MHFYVYEDDQANQIRIHVGSCWHCNEGKGRKPDRLLNKRRWYGPYATLEDAQELAKTLQKKDIRRCGICLPPEKLLSNLPTQLDRVVV